MSDPDYLCYILQSSDKKRTYVGITNHMDRRIRQHNGEITGGAKSTKHARPWSVVVMIAGFKTINHALMFEWAMHHMKHIGNGSGISKRFAQLHYLLCKSKWTQRAPLAHTVRLTMTFTSNELMVKFLSQMGASQLGVHIIIKSMIPRVNTSSAPMLRSLSLPSIDARTGENLEIHDENKTHALPII